MQPLVRPVSRAVLGHARLFSGPGLKLAPASSTIRPGPIAGLRLARRPGQNVLTSGYYMRSFSSQPPSKPDQEKATAESADSTAQAPEEPQKTAHEAETPTQHELPSTTESRRSVLDKKFGKLMDDVQAKLVNASHTLNDITGYTGIESIKAQNTALEAQLAEAHARVRSSRQAYKTSNSKRANTQREVTTLLARKDTWSPQDLERFTTLYRADHELEGEVAAAQEALTEAEADEQKLNQKLNSGILKRYHEEQIWSDRIRRASTWGTWGLMGMNFLLFLMLQFVAEPWKRKRLVKGVVAEEKQVLEEVRAELAAVKVALEAAKTEPAPAEIDAAISEVVASEAELPEAAAPEAEEVVPESLPSIVEEDTPSKQSWSEFLADPTSWKAAAVDLYSERMVQLRMRDASILALEGAAAGAVVAGSIAMLLLRA